MRKLHGRSVVVQICLFFVLPVVGAGAQTIPNLGSSTSTSASTSYSGYALTIDNNGTNALSGGIHGETSGAADGIYGRSATGRGVYGLTEGAYGVEGLGVTAGVYGSTYNGASYGVRGSSTSSYGVYGSSSSGVGVLGSTSGLFATGIWGTCSGSWCYGVYAEALGTQSNGVYAFTYADGVAITGANTCDGSNCSGYSGYFTGRVHVSGHIYAGSASKPGGGSWTSSSDARLKRKVQPLVGPLARLLRLRGVTYEWTEPNLARALPGTQVGFIAQDVERVFPEWVGTDNAGYKTLTIRGFESLTVEALRELDTANKRLAIDNQDLRKRLLEQDQRLQKIEAALQVRSK